jgi:hypothetical protein
MAGYLFLLDSEVSLTRCIEQGVYATQFHLNPGTHFWNKPYEATFGDYATMHEGDNVYFFINRKIYGIGVLTNVGNDCKYFNYPTASTPSVQDYLTVQPNLLWDQGPKSVDQRCICSFRPDPCFFRDGVDMDDVLSSNPMAFKMLRVIWKVSFIKFDDIENQAFRDILIKRNQNALARITPDNVFSFAPANERMAERLRVNDHRMQNGISVILDQAAEGTVIRHEMAIEAGILHQLSAREPSTYGIFGNWDYLSQQVVASPFKPVDYMDRMDIFGYSYVPEHKPTISKHLIIEIKKDAAEPDNVEQVMRYVDWVKDEYTHGDYSTIQAFLVAYDFDGSVIERKNRVGKRKYIIGVRPARSLEWDNLRLIRYSYNVVLHKLEFTPID